MLPRTSTEIKNDRNTQQVNIDYNTNYCTRGQKPREEDKNSYRGVEDPR